jgi:hypothetical protein
MTQTSKSAFAALLVSCLLLTFPVFAQIKAVYRFGVIGATGDTTVRLSEPVIIEYSKCFAVTNGVPKFETPKPGVFSISCNEAAPKVNLMVNAYPNPVINQLTMRSLVNYPDRGKTVYRVTLADFTGKLIREVKTDLKSINEGFSIRVADLPMGYFIVTLFADQEVVQSFKILKAA